MVPTKLLRPSRSNCRCQYMSLCPKILVTSQQGTPNESNSSGWSNSSTVPVMYVITKLGRKVNAVPSLSLSCRSVTPGILVDSGKWPVSWKPSSIPLGNSSGDVSISGSR